MDFANVIGLSSRLPPDSTHEQMLSWIERIRRASVPSRLWSIAPARRDRADIQNRAGILSAY